MRIYRKYKAYEEIDNRKLIKVNIKKRNDGYKLRTDLGSNHDFKGNDDAFALFLRRIKAKDIISNPKSFRKCTYKQMVNDIENGNNEVWVWKGKLKNLDSIIDYTDVKVDIENNINIEESINIHEAGFSTPKAKETIPKIANQLSKRIGDTYIYAKAEEFSNARGNYIGYYLIGSKGDIIRLNVSEKDGSSKIAEVDYFKSIDSNVPVVTIDLMSYGIVQVLNEVAEVIKSKDFKILEESLIYEKKEIDFTAWYQDIDKGIRYLTDTRKRQLYSDYMDYAKKNNLDLVSEVSFNSKLDAYLKKMKLVNKYSRKTQNKVALKDNKSISKEMLKYTQFVQNEFGNSFEDLEEEINLLIKVINKSKGKDGKVLLIVNGEAGVGKSTVVRKAFKNISGNKGMVTDKSFKTINDFYKFMFKNGDSVMLFNDTDSLLKKNSKFRGMMLGAFNTQYNERIITAEEDRRDPELAISKVDDEGNVKKPVTKQSFEDKSGKYPLAFYYNGAGVFTTNLPFEKIDKAVLDRAFTVTLEVDSKSILEAIIEKQGDPSILKGYSNIAKKRAIDFISERITSVKNFDFRAYVSLVQYAENVPQAFDLLASKELLKYGMK
jgi:hypothetical protein